MISKALIDTTDDTTPIQTCKVSSLDSEVFDGIERIQEYGFSSVPPKDSEAVIVEVGGARDHLLVIATDSHDHRPAGGQPGEVQIFSQYGQVIKLAKDGSVTISTPSGQGAVTIQGNLTVTGTSTFIGTATFQAALTALTVTAGLIPSLAVKLLTHVHPGTGAPPTPGS